MKRCLWSYMLTAVPLLSALLLSKGWEHWGSSFMVISWFICGRRRAYLPHLSVSLPLVSGIKVQAVVLPSDVPCRVWLTGLDRLWSQSVWTHQAKNQSSHGWLIVLIRSQGTAQRGFQTEQEEGKESSMKETDFRTRGWWAHHWRWSCGTSTQHSPWWGWWYIQQQLNAPPCPLLNCSLLGYSVFLLQFLSSCLLLFSEGNFLLGCSFPKAEALLGWSSYFDC